MLCEGPSIHYLSTEAEGGGNEYGSKHKWGFKEKNKGWGEGKMGW